ncbi:MAG: hypothetical protein ACLUNX_04030 [Angelakisella sp.]
MPHSEKLLQRETLGKNRVFTHERWHVRLENGRTAEREIIRHPGGVGIVAVDENGRLLMVRQYRSGMGCEALEIPAGKRDPERRRRTAAAGSWRRNAGSSRGGWSRWRPCTLPLPTAMKRSGSLRRRT